MSTTTIRLSDDLKARVARAAERTGTTTHGFIVDAIAEKTEEQERRDEFHALAEQRFSEFLRTGKSIPWSEAREYLLKRIDGKPAERPVARKLKS
jgi:predicted transcriptional regulator